MLFASSFIRVKHFSQRSRFPEVERDECDNMISREDRKAAQRGGLGVSSRRVARSARAEFLAKTARQRKGGAGGFFASRCALCESRISRKGRHAPQRFFLLGLGEPILSLAKDAMRRKEKHPVLGGASRS